MPAFRVLRRTVIQDETCGGDPDSPGGYFIIRMELSPSAGSLPYFCPLDTSITGTPSGNYDHLGGTTTDSRGNIWYAGGATSWFTDDTGYNFTSGPRPNNSHVRGFAFPIYNFNGGDMGGLNVGSKVGFVFAGAGTAEFLFVEGATPGGGYNLAWEIDYQHSSGFATQSSGSAIGPCTLTISTGALPDDANNCYRIIIVTFGEPIGGAGGATFVNMTWTAD